MSDRGSGYMINVGDKVISRNGEKLTEGILVKIDMEGFMDTIQTESGYEIVDRGTIYPANIQEIYSYNKMREELNQGICEVTFTKKNGEERVMPCTLVFDHIPEEHHPKGTGTGQHNSQETIAVWCMTRKRGVLSALIR